MTSPLHTTKAVMVNGDWVRVPATLIKTEAGWKETLSSPKQPKEAA